MSCCITEVAETLPCLLERRRSRRRWWTEGQGQYLNRKPHQKHEALTLKIIRQSQQVQISPDVFRTSPNLLMTHRTLNLPGGLVQQKVWTCDWTMGLVHKGSGLNLGSELNCSSTKHTQLSILQHHTPLATWSPTSIIFLLTIRYQMSDEGGPFFSIIW